MESLNLSFGDIDIENSNEDAELLVASFESDVLDTEAIVVEGRLGSNMPEDVLQEPAEDNEPILAVQGLQQEDDLLLDAKEEPVEDNPPTLAVQGFRPSDYTYDAFSIGMRLRWAISKTDSWNDGIVTGVRLLPVHTCELDVTRLGNHPPGTVTKLTFPSDVHEISIVHPPKHFMLSINDLRPGYHIAFDSDNIDKRFCGWIKRITPRRYVYIEATTTENLGIETRYEKVKMSNCNFTHMLRSFEYIDDKEDIPMHQDSLV